jgi:hypothetical protein
MVYGRGGHVPLYKERVAAKKERGSKNRRTWKRREGEKREKEDIRERYHHLPPRVDQI